MEGFVEPTRPVSFERLSILIAQRDEPVVRRRRGLWRAAGLVSVTCALAAGILIALTAFVTAPI